MNKKVYPQSFKNKLKDVLAALGCTLTSSFRKEEEFYVEHLYVLGPDKKILLNLDSFTKGIDDGREIGEVLTSIGTRH